MLSEYNFGCFCVCVCCNITEAASYKDRFESQVDKILVFIRPTCNASDDRICSFFTYFILLHEWEKHDHACLLVFAVQFYTSQSYRSLSFEHLTKLLEFASK